ncbi:hypothetical protein D9M71_264220 [compost metagenome]
MFADQLELGLRGGFGEEVVDPGLGGDGGGGQRVVAGHHHGADAQLAQLGEALADARLDHVLQVDGAEQPAVGHHQQRRATALGDAFDLAGEAVRHVLAGPADEGQGSVHRALAVDMAVHVDAGQAGFRAEGDGRQLFARRLVEAVLGAQVLDDGLAFRRIVGQRGEQGALPQLAGADAGRRMERAAAAVAEGDGAGLVQHQHMHVARRLHRAAGLGDHVQAHQAVHASNADSR